MNKIKIFIDCSVQKDRFDDILNYSINLYFINIYKN